jgi:hypothetical protein
MIKIKLTCSWESSEKITKRLLNQFVTSDEDLDGIEFTQDDSYDFMFIFGYVTEIAKNNKKMFLFPQEPRWSGGHQKSFNGINNLTVLGFEKLIYNPQNIVQETVAHMFYGGTGDDSINWNYNNIKNYDFNKIKNISTFVSSRGIDHQEYDEDCLYPDRINLINYLTKTIEGIDYYGWENKLNGNKLDAPKKFEKIKDYKFSLAIENSNEKFYVSEKFYDCILTNTIPIYFGCKNIKEYWPEHGYILLDNITDYEYIKEKFDFIIENSDELYRNMLPELLKIKERYFKEFNIIKKIKKIVYENIDR